MATIELPFTVPGFGAAKTIQLRGSWDRYSYLIDGCHDHLLTEPSTYEPKIGNHTNILNTPRQSTIDIPKGRPLSSSQIISPQPKQPSSQPSPQLASHLTLVTLEKYSFL
ncbi:hypothetical protein BDZ45DRAFT_699336 [Acephala macrosclerotiorum]|nr:hypothetical protein BDZ45DRAFT_699336 [Acephala macrosclerotiorum]